MLLTLRRFKDDKVFLLTLLVVVKIKRTSLLLAKVVVFVGGLSSKDDPCLKSSQVKSSQLYLGRVALSAIGYYHKRP